MSSLIFRLLFEDKNEDHDDGVLVDFHSIEFTLCFHCSAFKIILSLTPIFKFASELGSHSITNLTYLIPFRSRLDPQGTIPFLNQYRSLPPQSRCPGLHQKGSKRIVR